MNRHRALEALSLSVCQPWKSWFNNSSLRYSAAPVNRKPFPVLPDTLDVNVPEIQSATRTAHKHIAKLAELKELVRLGGGEKAQASYVRKKVLPRDRITRILDDPDEDLLEIGIFAGLGMPYGDVPSAGTICCIGKVHGRYCMISATEGTFKGGTMFPITVTKQISVLDKAEKCGLPFVFFIDSGGAFLPLQSLLFPDKMGGGRVFYLESVLGSQGLPTVAVICGSCTAGGAYGPALCQEAGITDKTGTVFLGGPPLVKAALGYDIGAQELGGAELHSRVSGVTDYFLGTEDEGFDVVRDVIATTNYSSSDCTAATTWEEPLHDASHLDCQ
ncbi:methylcrotonoyl-CoA carboxylase beta chain, mitochondrial-like [Hyalella azteca]|uniref:methylcrotonoyl-CoA carboxylase n=1 Tax=Hyalella azteca TaxID=294128 RepID=A0A8B7PLL9_HYAAZ|nr:methylcrotonoyl-CoA carboxylase beta chain, mitochondrial-like [Hyalella azteca]